MPDLPVPDANHLLAADDDQLFELLGRQAAASMDNLESALSIGADKEIARDLKAILSDIDSYGKMALTPELNFHLPDFRMRDVIDALRRVGERIFQRWETEAYCLVCGADQPDTEDRDALLTAIGLGGAAAMTAALAGLLGSAFGIPLAVGTVIAAIVIKRFLAPTHVELCGIWRKSLEERGILEPTLVPTPAGP